MLQVNITWEDILQEEQNKGIFDMELEDLEEDVDKDGKDGGKVSSGYAEFGFYTILVFIIF